MSDIVSIEDYLRRHIKSASPDEEADEQAMFLLTEGLDVLAAYRAIKDKDVRLSIRRLLEELAKVAVTT